MRVRRTAAGSSRLTRTTGQPDLALVTSPCSSVLHLLRIQQALTSSGRSESCLVRSTKDVRTTTVSPEGPCRALLLSQDTPGAASSSSRRTRRSAGTRLLPAVLRGGDGPGPPGKGPGAQKGERRESRGDRLVRGDGRR